MYVSLLVVVKIMVTMLEQLKFKRNSARSRLLAVCLNSGIDYNENESTQNVSERVKKDFPSQWTDLINKFGYTKKEIQNVFLYDE